MLVGLVRRKSLSRLKRSCQSNECTCQASSGSQLISFENVQLVIKCYLDLVINFIFINTPNHTYIYVGIVRRHFNLLCHSFITNIIKITHNLRLQKTQQQLIIIMQRCRDVEIYRNIKIGTIQQQFYHWRLGFTSHKRSVHVTIQPTHTQWHIQ